MWCMTVFLRQWNLDQGPLLSAEQTKTAEPRDVPISRRCPSGVVCGPSQLHVASLRTVQHYTPHENP